MEREKVPCFLFKNFIVLNKVIPFYRIVGVATTAGAKALPKPPGVLGGQGPMNISWKNQVLKWHITLLFYAGRTGSSVSFFPHVTEGIVCGKIPGRRICPHPTPPAAEVAVQA